VHEEITLLVDPFYSHDKFVSMSQLHFEESPQQPTHCSTLSPSSSLSRMTDDLQVVAHFINDVSSVEVGVIMGAKTRRAVTLETGLHSVSVELVDEGPFISVDREMDGSARFLALPEPQERAVSGSVAHPDDKRAGTSLGLRTPETVHFGDTQGPHDGEIGLDELGEDGRRDVDADVIQFNHLCMYK